ncbi:MAG: RNA 2',3'-cyclic phosphodiesterase [Chloroflexi bacterium]|nr:RNA 2',3'-cyclic phosphodiesterase [Chloroflexota bacterium]
MESVRAFIAVELPPALREGLARVQAQLRPRFSSVKWVEPEGIHLTLKFLGQVPTDQVEVIGQALGQLAQGISPFIVEVEGLGGFPNLMSPRVLWIGLKAPDSLVALQTSVEEAMASLHYLRESRSFSPHLTLGRVREGAAAGERRRLGEAAQALPPEPLGPFRVEQVSLMQSTLTLQGARYRCLAAFLLSSQAPLE